MITAPEVFAGGSLAKDPCEGYRKYVEVAFKCKPTQFRQKTACHDDTMTLTCDNPDEERLAIYSAHFAPATGTHMFCSDVPVVYTASSVAASTTTTDKYSVSELKKCEESFATEAVMQMCHGKGERQKRE